MNVKSKLDAEEMGVQGGIIEEKAEAEYNPRATGREQEGEDAQANLSSLGDCNKYHGL